MKKFELDVNKHHYVCFRNKELKEGNCVVVSSYLSDDDCRKLIYPLFKFKSNVEDMELLREPIIYVSEEDL